MVFLVVRFGEFYRGIEIRVLNGEKDVMHINCWINNGIDRVGVYHLQMDKNLKIYFVKKYYSLMNELSDNNSTNTFSFTY